MLGFKLSISVFLVFYKKMVASKVGIDEDLKDQT